MLKHILRASLALSLVFMAPRLARAQDDFGGDSGFTPDYTTDYTPPPSDPAPDPTADPGVLPADDVAAGPPADTPTLTAADLSTDPTVGAGVSDPAPDLSTDPTVGAGVVSGPAATDLSSDPTVGAGVVSGPAATDLSSDPTVGAGVVSGPAATDLSSDPTVGAGVVASQGDVLSGNPLADTTGPGIAAALPTLAQADVPAVDVNDPQMAAALAEPNAVAGATGATTSVADAASAATESTSPWTGIKAPSADQVAAYREANPLGSNPTADELRQFAQSQGWTYRDTTPGGVESWGKSTNPGDWNLKIKPDQAVNADGSLSSGPRYQARFFDEGTNSYQFYDLKNNTFGRGDFDMHPTMDVGGSPSSLGTAADEVGSGARAVTTAGEVASATEEASLLSRTMGTAVRALGPVAEVAGPYVAGAAEVAGVLGAPEVAIPLAVAPFAVQGAQAYSDYLVNHPMTMPNGDKVVMFPDGSTITNGQYAPPAIGPSF